MKCCRRRNRRCLACYSSRDLTGQSLGDMRLHGIRAEARQAARPVCIALVIGYEGGVNAPSLNIAGNAPGRRGRSLLDADPGPAILIALLIAITAGRVIALAISNAELFFDEAQYWAWGQEPAFGYYTKPPLIAWIIGATTSLCGDTPLCVRLPSPLMHFATSLVIYALA